MSTSTKIPNIFNYATSELSQDAIICYILAWAKIEYKKTNNDLYNLATQFLDSLFSKFENISKPLQYTTIEIKKQYKNIDVLCIVNEKYSIIIEDKTNTKNHSNQLERYIKTIKEDFQENEILPIYFKTGDQSNYDDVIKNNYKVYVRKDFLNALHLFNAKNDIIDNYTEYLQNIENSVNSYKILPIADWNYDSWKGFYIELRDRLKDGNWRYVSNKNGGFLGFYWGWSKQHGKYDAYLQIETNKSANNTYSGKIKFKLRNHIGEKIDKSIVNQWKKHIISNTDNIIINKPKVVRVGKSTTIGILENEFRITSYKNIIDMDKTIQFIKIIEKIKDNKCNTLKV